MLGPGVPGGGRARTLTIDVDGTVVSTGLQVGGARRGYNPHRRKVPGYYPKSTTRRALQSVATLRFELLNRAGRLVRPAGRLVLRLPRSPHLSRTYHRITQALRKAARE